MDEISGVECFVRDKKILFGVSTQGLGHASRELAFIRRLARFNELYLFSSGSALSWLKDAVVDLDIVFLEGSPYPPLQRGEGLARAFYLVVDSLEAAKIIKDEHEQVEDIVAANGIDLIISDGLYGCYSRKVPSFLISHQINFHLPKSYALIDPIAREVNRKAFTNFTKVFVPDFADFEKSLAGKLSHNETSRQIKAEYVGVLSSVTPANLEKDIDYLFIISGFLRTHLTVFVTKMLTEVRSLPGKKVFVLGDVSKFEHKKLDRQIDIYSYAPVPLRNELMSRAKTVVARCSYTTVMDLLELGSSGILIATPGQTEQIYLAEWLSTRGYFVTEKNQDAFDLKKCLSDLGACQPYPGQVESKSTLSILEKRIVEESEAFFARRSVGGEKRREKVTLGS